MNRYKQPGERPRLLRVILIGLFLYGGFSYSLSLLEYTFFQVSGLPVFGVAQTFTRMSDRQREQLIRDCGTQLMGASGLGEVASGSPAVVRCGRFWPFYRYSLQVPADPAFPGMEVRTTEPETQESSGDHGDNSTIRLINYATFVLAVVLLATSVFATWQIIRRRNEHKAMQWSLRAFTGSLILVAAYLGSLAWITPDFAMGW